MSEIWVRLVPREECYIPPQACITNALRYFCEEINGWVFNEADLSSPLDEVKAETFDALTYIDAGINDDGSVACPNCGDIIELEVLMAWEAEDEMTGDRSHFRIKSLECCGYCCTLRDLDYRNDQGFGLFCLEGIVDDALSPEQVTIFEKILHCKLRVIYAAF